MIERAACALSLFLLTACGGTDPAADDSVTATLPQAETAARNASTASNPAKAKTALAPGAASSYTSLELAACKLLEENVEEGGYSRRLCPGVAGYHLETSESDLREDVVVIAPGGRRSELNLSGVVANGAFSSLGKAAEWRGERSARPKALIVRLNVAADPEARKPDISKLVVTRLAPSTCVVAVVPPAPGQNEKAQAIADGKSPNCLGR